MLHHITGHQSPASWHLKLTITKLLNAKSWGRRSCFISNKAIVEGSEKQPWKKSSEVRDLRQKWRGHLIVFNLERRSAFWEPVMWEVYKSFFSPPTPLCAGIISLTWATSPFQFAGSLLGKHLTKLLDCINSEVAQRKRVSATLTLWPWDILPASY